MVDLSGKVAFVTGGGTGIGDAVARQLIAGGARVGVAGRRIDVLEQVARETGALALACDVSDPAAIDAAITELVSQFGGLDIIVNNAGITLMGNVEELSSDAWQTVMNVNLTGAMHVCKRGVPELRARGGGAIVNVSSIGGVTASANSAAYGTSKAGLIGLSRSLARDYGKHNIRVNTVCPGWVDTPMIQPALSVVAQSRGVSLDEARSILTRHAPLRRMAQPDELASCVLFLASPAASFVTGAVLIADGGQSIVDLGTLPLDPDV